MDQKSGFPNDENGHVLRSLASAGVDLSKRRPVEFMHLCPDGSAARAFAQAARDLGYEAEVFDPDEEALAEGRTEWDVCCVREMVPTHRDITETEAALAAVAREHACREDGWGFMD